MRSSWRSLIAIGVSLALAPAVAGADDVQKQLELMQERMMQLEDQLEATNEQLDNATQQVNEQRQVMHNAGLDDGRAGASGVDSFLQSLEIGGWVAVSYWHNANDPGAGDCAGAVCPALPASFGANTGSGTATNGVGPGTGATGIFNPHNPDSQGFSFDQLWFELERPVSPEQRSGFRADVLMGKTAGILAGGFGRTTSARSDNDVYVHQANIQYLADLPVLGDTKFTVGKFATLIGYEVVGTVYNDHISRGVLWAAMQPIDHLGVLVSGDLDQSVSVLGLEGNVAWDVGVVNGFDTDDPDVNHAKTFTGRVSWTGENWSMALAGITGNEDGARLPGTVASNAGFGGSESDRLSVLDYIVTWSPFIDLSLYANFDYLWADGKNGSNPEVWGLATGGRYEINDRLGLSLRTEYMETDDRAGLLFGYGKGQVSSAAAPGTVGINSEVISITSTVDYQLSDHIKMRGELRWDNVEIYGERGSSPTDSIFDEDNGGDSDQFVAGAEVIYEF